MSSAGPTDEAMYAAPGDVASGDSITAPRAWHFSNRSEQLDDRRQAALGEQAADMKRRMGEAE